MKVYMLLSFKPSCMFLYYVLLLVDSCMRCYYSQRYVVLFVLSRSCSTDPTPARRIAYIYTAIALIRSCCAYIIVAYTVHFSEPSWTQPDMPALGGVILPFVIKIGPKFPMFLAFCWIQFNTFHFS